MVLDALRNDALILGDGWSVAQALDALDRSGHARVLFSYDADTKVSLLHRDEIESSERVVSTASTRATNVQALTHAGADHAAV